MPLSGDLLIGRGFISLTPLGTAGGVDKNALCVRDWQRLGAGFLEIGTVTPLPQKAHSGKTLDRSLKHYSLWNHLGFPNRGLEFVKERLSRLESVSPSFTTLGGQGFSSDSGGLESASSSSVTYDPSQKTKHSSFKSVTPPLFINIGKNRQTLKKFSLRGLSKMY